MTLDEAAKYLALKHEPYPYPYQIRYWKSRLVILNQRKQISSDYTQEEIDTWIESIRNKRRVTVYFNQDVHAKLQERFKGQYGRMSDFVNRVVREAL